MTAAPRVAFVHDWLVSHRGGENVLEHLLRLFPDAPLYTLVHRSGSVSAEIENHTIHTSFIQNLPGAPLRFRKYLPLFPAAIEKFDLSRFDLIISTSHCVAKGVRLVPGQRHISYIHTPMRYIWDQLPHYVPDMPAKSLVTAAARLATGPMRQWDRLSSQRPTQLVANSNYVAKRIKNYWGRDSAVIFPPVDVDFYGAPFKRKTPRRGLLWVGALVPYKRPDLAVRYANLYGQPLRVIGTGPCEEGLRKMAGPGVSFESGLDREALRDAYRHAEVLVFPGVEDFGIVPVEAMAAGCPVAALGEGGALDTVSLDQTKPSGALFGEANIHSLAAAISAIKAKYKRGDFDGASMKAWASRFSEEEFSRAMTSLIQ